MDVEVRITRQVEELTAETVERARRRREGLLELVDDQKSCAWLVEFLDHGKRCERIGAGDDDVRRPRPCSGKSSAASQRNQPGSHK